MFEGMGHAHDENGSEGAAPAKPVNNQIMQG